LLKYYFSVSEGAVLVKELKPDTEYAFYLNGYNDVGQGAQAKLLDKTLISPPLGLIVQADPDYPDIVQLNWAFNANITKYRYVLVKLTLEIGLSMPKITDFSKTCFIRKNVDIPKTLIHRNFI